MSLRLSLSIMFLAFCFGIALGIGICKKTNSDRKTDQTNNIEIPVKIVRIKIPLTQSSNLKIQLGEFAEKWGYAIRVAEITPDGNDFNVQLWRSDIKIAGAYPIEPGNLVIGFYYTNPLVIVPDFLINREISDLREFIEKIPNATLLVEQ